MAWTCSAIRQHFWNNKIRYLVYGYIYLCTKNYVLWHMMQGISWQRNCHEKLKKALVDLSLGTMGIELWCLWLVFCFQSSAIVVLDLRFSCVWCIDMPLYCGVVLLLVFMVSFLVISWYFFYVLSVLGISWGRRKFNGARAQLCGTQQVM